MPKLIRYYLGEEPILPNVDTFDLTDPDQRKHVLAHLDRMVIKPSDASGGYGLVMGPSATDEELAQAARDVISFPRNYIAQPVVTFSTCPTVVEDGRIAPRHVDLRPFAVNDGRNVYVLPGGLSRVALPEGSLVVNSSQGGGSKDTWVIDDGVGDERPAVEDWSDDGATVPWPPGYNATRRDNSPSAHDDRILQQERQQQQAGDRAAGGTPC